MYKSGSFIDDIIKKRGMRVEFIVVEDDLGEKNFIYILSSEEDFEKLQGKLNSGEPFDITEYGSILIQGKGAEPPEGIEEELKQILNN
jgi:hypothetical protein